MFEFNAAIIAAILGFVGIGILGFTEMIKRLFKAGGIWGYVISFAVSAIATAIILAQMSMFSWLYFALYTIAVFLEANGIYKVARK